ARDVKGSRRWLGVGPFGVQPSELMKLGVILLLAKLLSADRLEMRANAARTVALTLGVILVPVGLIYRQPDLGTAVLLYVIGMSMVLFSQMGAGAKVLEMLVAPALALLRVAIGLK